MFTITNKQIVANDVKRLDVVAETIARRVQPGQFVMVIPRENGEWIPLTVVEADPRRGTIALIFKEMGSATQQLGALPIKESIFSIIGPLGQPSVCQKKFGTVVCVATDLGTAQILPICRALTKSGNKVIGIIGARSRRDLVLEAQMRLSCYKILVAATESSQERKSAEPSLVKQLLEQQPIEMVYAVGNIAMMQAVEVMTKAKKIPFFVQINPVMCCGLGFCGSCRVKVNHQTILACEQGPEFDGHKVDFKDLHIRLNAYEKEARTSPTGKMRWESSSTEAPAARGKISKFFTDMLKG